MVLGLEAVQRGGHLHRDVKPNNFLVTREGHIVLADFDGIWPVGMPLAREEEMQFTCNYVPPETLRATEALKSADKQKMTMGDTILARLGPLDEPLLLNDLLECIMRPVQSRSSMEEVNAILIPAKAPPSGPSWKTWTSGRSSTVFR
ncbi:mitogen-activated protein kinase kinase 1c-like [Cyclospora cayetanensis]|uniref:non-specific serine/threonine protein kinase n=1 Tax=Cyclospora cayetanensis TaxID=88456 RepID=A0A6P6S2T0_9EIME|nr:mitogen-activated protein kinase kinase 1c-like [Cyclospora cayetanensis]